MFNPLFSLGNPSDKTYRYLSSTGDKAELRDFAQMAAGFTNGLIIGAGSRGTLQ